MAELPQATLMPWMEGDGWIKALNLVNSINDQQSLILTLGLISPTLEWVPFPFVDLIGYIMNIVAFGYSYFSVSGEIDKLYKMLLDKSMYPDDKSYLEFMSNYAASLETTRSIDSLNGMRDITIFKAFFESALFGFWAFAALPYVGWINFLIGMGFWFILLMLKPFSWMNAIFLTLP